MSVWHTNGTDMLICTGGGTGDHGFHDSGGAQEGGAGKELPLRMADEWQQYWSFVEGAWAQNEEGIITAPENLGDQNLAFYTPHAYTDFEAEFEFRWDMVKTSAAFLFRAQDARHYYVVDFPAVGQQYRAEHFWAVISKADESGWWEALHMEMLHGVTSARGVWHKVRIQVRGDEIRVWVEGRPVTAVRDATYRAPGRIGLATYSGLGATARSSFRNLRIRGQAVEAPAWDESVQPVRTWSLVDAEHGTGCGNIARTTTGELLVTSAGRLLRSADNGRTWSVGEELPEGLRGGLLRIAPDGGVENYYLTSKPPFKLQKTVSHDHGRTWAATRDLRSVTFPPETPFAQLYQSRLLETNNGVLLLFVEARTGYDFEVLDGRFYFTRPRPSDMNLCFRSTDGGETWTGPVDMDGPPHDDTAWQIWKEADEISAAQTLDGKIMALIRPLRSPFMWETWSEDEGQTWTPLTRGPFPMYACSHSMIATASGALLIGGRFPGLAVQVSHDSGMTWKCYMIDASGGWANGAMYELEPDVVLFIYGGWNTPDQLRCQVLRVTPTGLEAVT